MNKKIFWLSGFLLCTGVLQAAGPYFPVLSGKSDFSRTAAVSGKTVSRGGAYAASLFREEDSARERLRRDVLFLTSDSLQGRAAGSRGEKQAAEYIYERLSGAGVEMISPRSGDDFYLVRQDAGDTVHSLNVIGIVPGTDEKLRNEYIVIGAHMDHLGMHKMRVDGRETAQIYPGADDNASGVSVLLETARQVSAARYLFRRSVIFAFFGAEELGMAGSWYFLNRSFPEPDRIVMMINLDMVGRSGGDNKIQVFTGAHNWILNKMVNDLSRQPLSLSPSVSPTDYFPSDHRTFYEKGIPVVLFTSGVHREYHTPRDREALLDYVQMEGLSHFVTRLAREISDREERIAYPVAANPEAGTSAETEADRIYSQQYVDKPAQFLHGDERQFLNKWVYPYLKYPDSAVAAGERGTVIATFVIEKDGKVSRVEIAEGVSDAIDDEVVKVISASPKWKPARLNGRPVRVKISVPVEFRLK